MQLYDHASDTYVWDAPEYDPATGIINCTLVGSAFGSSAESTYKLAGLKAEPLAMHYQFRNPQNMSDAYYTGMDNKWHQDSLAITVSMLDFTHNKTEPDYTAYQLYQDGSGTLKLLRHKDDWESALTYQESIDFPDWAKGIYITEMKPIPGYKMIDFNKDGTEDLMFYLGQDVHGSLEAIIFLHDPNTKQLIKLQNTAEGTDVWDTPEYNPKTKTITCNRISGNAGLSFTSTYKLTGFTAQPLTKEVKDHTNHNAETGKGYSESSYTGKNGKWKLKK